jgi:hypothetical protein
MENFRNSEPKGLEGLVGFRVALDAHDPCWELHAVHPKATPGGLLGWVMQTPLGEAGVPESVSRILSRALCRRNWLTFLHNAALSKSRSPGWQSSPKGWTCVLEPPGLNWLGRKPLFPLICTSSPEMARHLFNAERFAWELKSQIVFFSNLDSEPPSLAYSHIENIMNGRIVDRFKLSESGASGLMLPAVDGDFAQFVFFDEPNWQAVQEELRRECESFGIEWKTVSESEFKNTSWFRRAPSN